ncbi:MAG: hypothetical protein WA705_15060 [Candidatus Ozemobacteraceae bacterium]
MLHRLRYQPTLIVLMILVLPCACSAFSVATIPEVIDLIGRKVEVYDANQGKTSPKPLNISRSSYDLLLVSTVMEPYSVDSLRSLSFSTKISAETLVEVVNRDSGEIVATSKALTGVALNPTSVSAAQKCSIDLRTILVTARYSDGTKQTVKNVTWAKKAGTGNVNKTTYTASAEAGIETLTCTYSEAGVTITQPLEITVTSSSANPTGPNLALSAVATCDSWWSELGATHFGFWVTPDKGNNGNLDDFWVSHYDFSFRKHWYGLAWLAPVVMNRVYLSNICGSYGEPGGYGATIDEIKYFDKSTQNWIQLPLPSTQISACHPPFVDFRFPAVSTTGIRVLLHSGPENPQPNGAVFLAEVEVYGPSTP